MRTFHRTTWFRLVVCAVVGVAVGFAVAGARPAWAPLGGWIATAASFTAWTWLDIRRLDADEVREFAQSEDPGRGVGDLVLLLASLGAVVGVGMLLLGSSPDESHPALDALVGVGSVVASWVVVHLMWTLHYARLHYADPDHGVDFEGDEDPTYADFAYTAYTVGMTYQVSDTGFKSRALRVTALRHGLVSYFLGAFVIACTINLVVQLAAQ